MKDIESPYPGAVIAGLGVVMPHPSQPGQFVLPGGITCNRHKAEEAAKKLHDLQAKEMSSTLRSVEHLPSTNWNY